MNTKIFITISLAILLAFLCAFYIFKQEKTVDIVEKKQQIVQVIQEEQIKVEDNTIEEKKEIQKFENAKNEPPIFPKKNNDSLEKDIKENSVVENIVQEASIVEEVSDCGIMKDENGNIVITRAFSPQANYKYSFRDFGIIDKVSSK